MKDYPNLKVEETSVILEQSEINQRETIINDEKQPLLIKKEEILITEEQKPLIIDQQPQIKPTFVNLQQQPIINNLQQQPILVNQQQKPLFIQQPQQPVTSIIYQQQQVIIQTKLTSNPKQLICPYCKQNVQTVTTNRIGIGNFVICGLIGFVTHCWCLAPVALCLPGLNDVEHHCPSCKSKIGTNTFIDSLQ